MTDRLKISLFDTLAPYGFAGARVLDLYAGSGSLGIEMLSRGADWCDFVEHNPSVCAIIRDNLRTTGLADRAHVYKMFVARFLAMRARTGTQKTKDGRQAISSLGLSDSQSNTADNNRLSAHSDHSWNPEGIALDTASLYDIILLDPPYADPEIGRTLETIARSSLIADDGLVVIGHRKGVVLADDYGHGRITRVRHRAMGDSAFSIYELVNDWKGEMLGVQARIE
jgi:16S rRNA (guanine966-N2)-methyltransferase